MCSEIAKVLDDDFEAACVVRYEALQVAAFAISLDWYVDFFVSAAAADRPEPDLDAVFVEHRG